MHLRRILSSAREAVPSSILEYKPVPESHLACSKVAYCNSVTEMSTAHRPRKLCVRELLQTATAQLKQELL